VSRRDALGDHEDWMLKTLRDPTRHSWILGMEAFETIASYSGDAVVSLRQELERAGMRLITERVRINYEVFFDLVPREHLDLLKGLRLYYRTPDVVCVHAGVDLKGSPLHLQDPETLLWGPDGFPDGYRGQEAVVYGHWNNSVIDETGWPGPRTKANRTYGIDSISHGVLTAMRFPEGRVVQSGKYVEGSNKQASPLERRALVVRGSQDGNGRNRGHSRQPFGSGGPVGESHADNGQNDVLVLLGDYIDRGPDTRGCLDRIVRLKEEAGCAVVTLRGNHEAWMLRSLCDPRVTSGFWRSSRLRQSAVTQPRPRRRLTTKSSSWDRG